VTPSIRKKLALTSPTSGGRSVGIVRLRTKSTEFSLEVSLEIPASQCCHVFSEVHMNSYNQYQSNGDSAFDDIFLVFSLCCDSLSSKHH
jgi:hypothetical protein